MSTETQLNSNEASQDNTLQKGRLVVLAGPSAVGKSTIVQRLREELPELYFSVSATTRDPRPGEVDGQDYHFVTKDRFQKLIDTDQLLEWADIHSGLQRSGTPRQPVIDALEAGKPVLVEVDLAGARQIRKTMPEALQVFLAPPSWEELVKRLVNRATESQEVIDRRLATAKSELEAQSEFDQIVVNDDLEKAVQELISCWNAG